MSHAPSISFSRGKGFLALTLLITATCPTTAQDAAIVDKVVDGISRNAERMGSIRATIQEYQRDNSVEGEKRVTVSKSPNRTLTLTSFADSWATIEFISPRRCFSQHATTVTQRQHIHLCQVGRAVDYVQRLGRQASREHLGGGSVTPECFRKIRVTSVVMESPKLSLMFCATRRLSKLRTFGKMTLS